MSPVEGSLLSVSAFERVKLGSVHPCLPGSEGSVSMKSPAASASSAWGGAAVMDERLL